MNVPPVSVERVQKCVVNFEIYRFLKKAANLPHPPLQNKTVQRICLRYKRKRTFQIKFCEHQRYFFLGGYQHVK